MSIEKRIEKLEQQSSSPGLLPEKLVSLLSRLTGFKERFGLGEDPTREEVSAAVHRMRSKRGIKELVDE